MAKTATTVVRGKVVPIDQKKAAQTAQPNSRALRKALSDFQREPMLEPHEIPLHVNLWRILVQPVPPLKSNPGGKIELADDTQKADEIATAVGLVLQLGHFAYKSKTPAGLNLDEEPLKPSVGQYVLYETYAGQEIKLRTGKKVRVLLDTEVLAIVSDPDEIRAYI